MTVQKGRYFVNLRGQTLFEVTIAVAVAVMVIISIVAAATVSVRNANFARNQAEATRFAQEALEWIRAQRDASTWEDFLNTVKFNEYPPAVNEISYCLPPILSWDNDTPRPDPTFCTNIDDDKIQKTFQRIATLERTVESGSGVVTSVRAEVIVSWEEGLRDPGGVPRKHSARVATDFVKVR